MSAIVTAQSVWASFGSDLCKRKRMSLAQYLTTNATATVNANANATATGANGNADNAKHQYANANADNELPASSTMGQGRRR